ncbi:MAG TPA: hypothetical protein VE377_14780 [Candidatus Dormibacteraeota bacterium]|nr:hypothetical protein [Candidatus Dormibacteraeota bacterium]
MRKTSRLVFLPVLLALAVVTGCHKTPFEQEHFNAEAGNPHWLEIDLDTADHRRTYKESESFGFAVGYSSAVRELYKLEIAEGSSTIVFTDRLHISDGQVESMHAYGVVCCSSRIIGLNDEPYVVHAQRRFRLKPGTYQVYMTTRRVFPWDITSGVYQPSDWVSASNLIKINVVPDPGWQERELTKFMGGPKNPGACMALGVLDTPEATAQKLENIRNQLRCPIPSPSGNAFNESEYPAALKGMDQLVQSPTHGVIRSDVNLIVSMKIWLTHPERRRVPENREEAQKFHDAEEAVQIDNEEALVRELCAVLPAKLPDARLTTQKTIDDLTRNILAGIQPCR